MYSIYLEWKYFTEKIQELLNQQLFCKSILTNWSRLDRIIKWVVYNNLVVRDGWTSIFCKCKELSGKIA